MSQRPKYCGPDSGTLRGLISAGIPGATDWPDWPQLRGRSISSAYLGRCALWHLAKSWNINAGDEILFPAYHCGSEVDPWIQAGAQIVLYRVDQSAQLDIDDLQKRFTPRTRVVYVIHYFGRAQPIVDLSRICRERGVRLVEDCALSLFCQGEGGPLGTFGDAALFSLKKFLPVPDGGLLTLKQPPGKGVVDFGLHAQPLRKSLRNVLSILKNRAFYMADAAGVYPALQNWVIKPRSSHADIALSADGRPDIPPDYYLRQDVRNWRMSRLARRMLRQVDVEGVIARRRRNYQLLDAAMAKMPQVRPLYSSLPEGVCPVVYPLVVPQRTRIAQLLNSCGINASAFWHGYHRAVYYPEFTEAAWLKENVLALPIHQSFGEAHICYIVQKLQELLHGISTP
jgi:perosamine synthetase